MEEWPNAQPPDGVTEQLLVDATDRRGALRRLEDCLALLEAAQRLGATVVTPRVGGAIEDRLPRVREGMSIADAMVAVQEAIRAEPEVEPRADRRIVHRRPAFDHQLLLGDLFPWRP